MLPLQLCTQTLEEDIPPTCFISPRESECCVRQLSVSALFKSSQVARDKRHIRWKLISELCCDAAPGILNQHVQFHEENVKRRNARFWYTSLDFLLILAEIYRFPSRYSRTRVPFLEPSPLHRTRRRSIRESLNPEFAEPGNLRAGNSSHLDGERANGGERTGSTRGMRQRGRENVCHSLNRISKIRFSEIAREDRPPCCSHIIARLLCRDFFTE